VFALGPPGTGKTALAVRHAGRLIRAGAVDRLLLTRPAVGCDEETGFLPGTAAEKMAPYLAALTSFLGEELPAPEIAAMTRDGRLESCPLGLMRGRTVGPKSLVIADEMQNATARQLRMLLTRIGDGGRIVLTGDLTQTDIAAHDPPLSLVVHRLTRSPAHPEVAVVRFGREDVLRGGLADWCDRRLSEDCR
jgi:phosphate starvation-inducible protein PhoH and related proteins